MPASRGASSMATTPASMVTGRFSQPTQLDDEISGSG